MTPRERARLILNSVLMVHQPGFEVGNRDCIEQHIKEAQAEAYNVAIREVAKIGCLNCNANVPRQGTRHHDKTGFFTCFSPRILALLKPEGEEKP